MLTEDTEVNGTYCLALATLDLNGHTMTINGDLIHAGGTININGGKLIVNGDYRVQNRTVDESNKVTYGKSTGALNMTNAEDYFYIDGDFISETSVDHTDKLTEGVMEITGDVSVSQNYSSKAFMSTDNHTIVLSGEEVQNINLGDINTSYCYNYSHFGNFTVNNTSDEGICFKNKVYVAGMLKLNNSKIDGTLVICGSTRFDNNEYVGDISINGAYGNVFGQEMTIIGDVELGSSISLSHNLVIDGNISCCDNVSTASVTIGGVNIIVTGNSYNVDYIMKNDRDYLSVSGDLSIKRISSLYKGTIELEGNLEIEGGYDSRDTHTIILKGDKLQTIKAEVKLGTVELQNYSEEGVYSDAPLDKYKLIRNGCRLTYGNLEGEYGWTLNSDYTYDGNLVLIDDELNLNGYTLTVNGDFKQISGTLNTNGGNLVVKGNYRMHGLEDDVEDSYFAEGTGNIVMGTDDMISVYGDLYYYTDSEITSGKLEIKGDLHTRKFKATDNNVILFSGDSKQSIGADYFSEITFASVEFDNNSEAGINIIGQMYVTKYIDDNDTIVSGTVHINRKIEFGDKVFQGNLYLVNSNVGLNLSGFRIVGDLTSYSSLYVNKDTTLKVDGSLTNYGRIVNEGTLVIENDYNQNYYGSLQINNGYLEIEGDCNLNCSNGYIRTLYDTNYIHIMGDLNSTTTTGSITLDKGVLEVEGDIDIKSQIKAGEGHKLLLSGDSLQTVNMSGNTSWGIIELQNYSEEGVYSETVFTKKQLIRNGCRLRYGDCQGEFGWTLSGDQTWDGDLVIIDDTLDLNGYTLTVTGNLIQQSGDIKINGGKLVVQGDYRMQTVTESGYGASASRLVMDSEDDYVLVYGDYIVETKSSQNACLKLGTVEIKGDIQINNYIQADAFWFGETATLILSGDEKQTISIKNKIGGIHLGNVKVNNTSTDKVVTDGILQINGTISTKLNSFEQPVYIMQSAKFEDDIFNGDVVYYDSCTIEQDKKITINGNVEVRSYVSIDGELDVKGNLYVRFSGIGMDISDSYLKVEGDFSSDIDMDSIVAGTLEVTGDISSSSDIEIMDEAKLVLSGEEKQIVDISLGSQIETLELRNTSDEGVYSENYFRISNLIENSSKLTIGVADYQEGFTLTEDTTISGYYYLGYGVLNLNGYKLNIEGNLVHAGGVIDINGGELNISNNYIQKIRAIENGNKTWAPGWGQIIMDDPEDKMYVLGDMQLCPQERYSYDNIKDGCIYIQGDLNITNKPALYQEMIFYTLDNNHVYLQGDNQVVKGTGYEFANLHINTSDSLKLNTDILVTKTLDSECRNMYGTGYIAAETFDVLNSDTFDGNLCIRYPDTLISSKNIKGNLLLSWGLDLNGYEINCDNLTVSGGTIKLNGGRINCLGDFYMGGRGFLLMRDSNDYICVGGDVNFYSYVSHTDKLTAGTLELKGDFVDYYEKFKASGTHKTILGVKYKESGKEYIQYITSDSDDTTFNTLVLKKDPSKYVFSRDVEDMAVEVIYDIEDTRLAQPVTNLKTTAVGITSITIQYEQEDNAGTIGYIIYRDGERIGSTGVLSYTDSDVEPNTTYSYEVYPVNSMYVQAETSPKLQVTTLSDTEGPTAPGGLSITGVTGSSITLSWSASTDNLEVVGYEIYRDGENIAVIAYPDIETTYKDSNIQDKDSHSYTVVAYDEAGNRSEQSAEITGKVVMPVITQVSPEDYSQINNRNQKLSVYYKNNGYGDGYSVDILYRAKGDEAWIELDTTGLNSSIYNAQTCVISYDWDTSALGETEYEVKYIVKDQDGNISSQVVNYYVDNVPPALPSDIKITSMSGTIRLDWNASVSHDCDGYRIYRRINDSGDEYTLIHTEEDKLVESYTDVEVEEGVFYEYAITAIDTSGNESKKSEGVKAKAVPDEEPPTIAAVSPEAGKINGSTKISITAKDNKELASVSISYRRDDEEQWTKLEDVETQGEAVNYTLDTKDYPDGVYYFNFTATDASGNTSQEEYTRRYEIDNTGISKIVITEVTSGSTYVQLKWDDVPEKDFAYFQVEMRNSYYGYSTIAQVDNVLGYTVEGLNPNTRYTFRVVGVDTMGNKGEYSFDKSIYTKQDTISPTINAVYPTETYFRNNMNLSVKATDNHVINNAIFSYSYDGETYTKIKDVKATGSGTSATINHTFDLSGMPEGKLYIKYEVYDRAGNKNVLTADGEDVVNEYIIDKTAPSKPGNLMAVSHEGYIGLSWDKPEDTDVYCYKVYRADVDDGIFICVNDRLQNSTYNDADIQPGESYIYRLVAVDKAGNQSEYSNQCTASATKDKTAPYIAGISLQDGSVVGEKTALEIIARDNSKLGQIEMDIKDTEDGIWLNVDKKAASGSIYQTTLDLKLENMPEGEYTYRIKVIDKEGNESGYTERTFRLDTTPAVADISATTSDLCIKLAVTLPVDEDFTHVDIYRRKKANDGETGGSFTKIYTGKQAEYTDKDITPWQEYEYKLHSYDKVGNCHVSDIVTAYGTDNDVICPVAKLPDSVRVMEGMELQLDGGESTDNVRIKSYAWAISDGSTYTGRLITHTFTEEGEYTVTLRVTDAAGNSSTATTKVDVIKKDGAGSITITVVDTAGTPVPYAYVYLSDSLNSDKSYKTDGAGKVTISANRGEYKAAAYKTGYIPKDIDVTVSEYTDNAYTITIPTGEIVVGDFTIHKMSLQEMVEAGVDFSAPENMHRFTFDVELQFTESPIPVEIVYVSNATGGGTFGGSSGGVTDNFIINWGGGKENKATVQIVQPVTATGEPTVDEPIIVTVRTIQTVSWLKDMYSVELGVLNTADSKYVIEDSCATINLPQELSLTTIYGGQSYTTYMGDIAGQERKTTTWIVKGDKPGDYEISADFSGNLTPFNCPVNAHFTCNQTIGVSDYSGLNICVMPESTAYTGEDYYIQFSVTNDTDRPLYNFTTTFGPYTVPGAVGEVYVIQPGSEEKELYDSYRGNTQFLGEMSMLSQTPVLKGDERLSIATLAPGQTIYGTYSCGFPGTADPTEYYYVLTDSVVKVLEGNDLGVSVSVKPIGGHISKRIIKGVVRESMFGDPVDVTTGAYIDEYEALSITGRDTLSLDLYYSSLDSNTEGELGYGWSHNFESYIVEDMGMVHYYTSPATCASFVNEDSLNGIKYGTFEGNTLSLSSDTGKDTITYRSITTGMDGYVLTKYADGTFAMTTPAGYIYEYGADGKLTKMTLEEDRSVSISHAVDQIIVTEDATGNRLKLDYSNGRLISVTDNTGRTTNFAYTGDYLTAITNPIGETVSYEYDEAGRLNVGKNTYGEAFVTNTYDEVGRVVKQLDDRGNEIGFTYTDTDTGRITECIAADGSITTVESDLCGNITKITTPQGAVTTHEYDRLGNKVKSVDAYGNTYSYSYDEKGNILSYSSDLQEEVSFTYDELGNVISLSSDEGTEGSYTYDEAGNMTYATDGQVSCSYTYDASGNLTSIERVSKGTTTYTYDDTGLFLSSATGENGYTSYVDYDNRGNLVMTKDASGAVTRYEYDLMNRKVKTINPDGGEIGYTYDVYGNISSVTDPMGYTTTYAYDTAGRHTSTTYADGSTESFAYDELGNMTSVTSSDGRQVTYEYDGLGNVTKITYPDGTTEECTYDMLGQITSSTDIQGHKSVYNYDSTGTLSSITSSDGQTLTATYGSGNKIEKVTDNTGKTAKYTYDSKGNVTSMTDTIGNTVTYEYSSWGELISETDANGNKTTYTYDNAGQCTAVTNPEGTTTHMVYDPCGRVSEAYVDRGTEGKLSVSYTYDCMGNVSTYTDEMGNTTSYEYDLCGNLIKVTDSEGAVTEYTYDCMGKVLQEKDASGIVVTYSYNKSDLVEKVTMTSPTGEEKAYTYTYDDMGRVLTVTDPSGNVSSQSYDKAGNVTDIVYPEGGGISYTYDDYGRVTEEKLSIGTSSTYEYNADSLLSQYTNGRGQETDYIYDELGRITSVTDEIGTVSYTYDANGNVLTVSETDKSGKTSTITRTYDCMNRVETYTDYKGNTVKYGYDELGNLVSLTYPGGEIVRYDYDRVGLLTTVTDEEGFVTSYTYDKVGRLHTTTKPDGSIETNNYDKLGQLTERTVVGKDGKLINKYSYTYDGWGNILSISNEGSAEESNTTTLSSTSMTYDSSNRMVTYNGEAVLYDDDGNMTYGPLDGEMVTFTYDCRNRLTGAGDTTYEYDAENIRTATETPEYREEYVTDSVGELSRVLVITREYKTNSKTDTEKYYYGNGLIYEKSSEVGLLVYHYNHLGSTTAITDGEGKLVYSYDYGTYGELVSTTEYSNTTPIVRFLYNGQLGVTTDDNGLYYMRSRYYNPEIKRFINQDVLIGNITNSNSLNRYSYVEGNPISYTDPFGLSPFSYLNVFNPSVLIHTTLDVLGCLPGGSGFDLVNAAIYFLEGNDTEGWKSLVFVIPGMDLAGKGVKYGAKIGGKGGKVLETTFKTIDATGHLGSTFLSASDFGNGMAFMIDKYMVGEAEWSADTAWELASLAGHGFQLKSFSGSFMNNAKAGNYGSLLGDVSNTNIDMYAVMDSLSKYDKLDNRGSVILPFGNKGGRNYYGIVNGKTPASRFADKLRGLSNSKRPNTVAVIRTADGKYYVGYNKAGIYNKQIQDILDELGNTNDFNRQCAEVNAVSRALEKSADLEGATISIANVRGLNNKSGLHGTYKPPCNVCQPLLDYFKIMDIK